MERASAAYQQQKKEATSVGRQYSFDTIVGKSPAIQAAIALAQKVSATEEIGRLVDEGFISITRRKVTILNKTALTCML